MADARAVSSEGGQPPLAATWLGPPGVWYGHVLTTGQVLDPVPETLRAKVQGNPDLWAVGARRSVAVTAATKAEAAHEARLEATNLRAAAEAAETAARLSEAEAERETAEAEAAEARAEEERAEADRAAKEAKAADTGARKAETASARAEKQAGRA